MARRGKCAYSGSFYSPNRASVASMTTTASIEALIRECSMYEEHLAALCADAERDAPERLASLVELIERIRRLKAELVAVHPERLTDRAAHARRAP